jgi:hypothetical protein
MTEDDQLGQQKGFWKLIEEGEKSGGGELPTLPLHRHGRVRRPHRRRHVSEPLATAAENVPTPKPNFVVRSQAVTDRETGEKSIYREITVSTRFVATPSPAVPAKTTRTNRQESRKTNEE